ncbi:MAG: hypothetical protein CXT72_01775 [Methanobacteriota archaeon]|nr:MAG: hypothetical protein CXT72_01775 [Euryarchaeota archaeon]HIE63491.1 hypothetical protein [Candidatus Poseidoniales archaeon]HIL00224.1 hypothetical protein [Candidatus Poseidoniales archaeon]
MRSLLLAGGRSSRMGKDKAMIKIDGIAMIQRVAQALAEAGREPIRIAVSTPEKIEEYSTEIDSSLDVEWVLDGEQYAGPVDAILESLNDPQCANIDSVQLATVDVPWINHEVFWDLEKSLSENDVLAMPADPKRAHPLLSLIRPTELLKLLENWKGAPLHETFSEYPHTLLMIDSTLLRNVNQPSDLDYN